ncbi:MAG: TRAM domain-containing protein, partial [Lachnospiraceae bacterium]|nr:TRAM domain-containing protein [Lachnospiraceae bacterium]
QKIGREQMSRFTGQVKDVLVESVNTQQEGYVSGRLSNNTVVHFPGEADLIGKLVDVELSSCRGFYYIGKRV